MRTWPLLYLEMLYVSNFTYLGIQYHRLPRFSLRLPYCLPSNVMIFRNLCFFAIIFFFQKQCRRNNYSWKAIFVCFVMRWGGPHWCFVRALNISGDRRAFEAHTWRALVTLVSGRSMLYQYIAFTIISAIYWLHMRYLLEVVHRYHNQCICWCHILRHIRGPKQIGNLA